MDIYVKSSHTLCERIRIFLRKPTLDTLRGIFRNYYVNISEEERNCILNNIIYSAKVPSDGLDKRKVSLDEEVHATTDAIPIVNNKNEFGIDPDLPYAGSNNPASDNSSDLDEKNNEISAHEEGSDEDSDRNNLLEKEDPANTGVLNNISTEAGRFDRQTEREENGNNDHNITEEVIVDKGVVGHYFFACDNGRSGEEEKENNNTNESDEASTMGKIHRMSTEEAKEDKKCSSAYQLNFASKQSDYSMARMWKSAGDLSKAVYEVNEQYDEESKKANHVKIEKSKFNEGYVLSKDLIVREDFLKPGMAYYGIDTLEKKFVVKSADQDWCDKQVELEYRILLNSEVDTVLKDNLKFAKEQQDKQEDFTNFNDALSNKSLGSTVEVIVEEYGDKSGVASAQGKRPSMQDTHIVGTTHAVFDGHGKKAMSMHLESNMNDAICSELYRWRNVDNKIDCGDSVPMNEKARNVNALMMAHQKVNVENVTDAMRCMVGSTSVMANLIDDDLYISNLGDSRAILIAPDGTIVQMTEDAKNIDEVDGKYVANRHSKDVLERGGSIIILVEDVDERNYLYADYAKRVNGVLATPKAHGDRKFSDFDVRTTMAFSKRPDITFLEKPKDGWAGYKLLLCCDGLTDVASTQQIGEYVHKETRPEKNTSYKDIASKLVTAAYDANSLDNITVMLFDVDQMKATYEK